jgi:hypothetical protein
MATGQSFDSAYFGDRGFEALGLSLLRLCARAAGASRSLLGVHDEPLASTYQTAAG